MAIVYIAQQSLSCLISCSELSSKYENK